MSKYNKQIALLFLIIIFITVINIFVGKTITLKPCIIFETGIMQLSYFDVVDFLVLGLICNCDYPPEYLYQAVAYFVLLTPVAGFVFSLWRKRKLSLIFAVALAIYHLLAAIDLKTRIGLRHIDLGGAAARTVFCLDFFITLACTLLIVILSITGSIKERSAFLQ